MKEIFWHQRWEKGETAFHETEANHLLVSYFEHLNLAKGDRVLLPLCGKTSDISWLLALGYQVVGIELSEVAIIQLFKDLGVKPEVSNSGELIRYRAKGLEIFVGDIFKVSAQDLGPVDAVYDRAALVALPKEMRDGYVDHLIKITNQVQQLLICYEYEQRLLDGPPFSILEEEVNRHYIEIFELTCLDSRVISGGLKGKVDAVETAWLLKK